MATAPSRRTQTTVVERIFILVFAGITACFDGMSAITYYTALVSQKTQQNHRCPTATRVEWLCSPKGGTMSNLLGKIRMATSALIVFTFLGSALPASAFDHRDRRCEQRIRRAEDNLRRAERRH